MTTAFRRATRSQSVVPWSAALCVLLLSASQLTAQAPAASSLLGCVFDPMGYAIPGATIVVRGAGVERSTVTDAGGCYMVQRLPLASYRVSARMEGFDTATYDQVVGHADFILRHSRMCECARIEPPQTLADAWERAGGVMHVRLSEGDPAMPALPHYYRHQGAVLEFLKADPMGGPTIGTTVVLEHQENNAPPPLAAGQEVVVFGKWADEVNGFVGLGTSCCDNPEVVFHVVDGRIRQAPALLSEYTGMEIGRFLQELRSLAHAHERPAAQRVLPNVR